MKAKAKWVVCVASFLLVASCGDAGTGVNADELRGSFALQQIDGTPLPIAQRKIVGIDTSGATTSSCTDYLSAMSIDVTSADGAIRSESHDIACEGAANYTSSSFESGRVSKTADGWRFDFPSNGQTLNTHYFGRLNGNTLTIVRRETDAMSTGAVIVPATVSLSQLVFKRL